jgi:hypothetical protein
MMDPPLVTKRKPADGARTPPAPRSLCRKHHPRREVHPPSEAVAETTRCLG